MRNATEKQHLSRRSFCRLAAGGTLGATPMGLSLAKAAASAGPIVAEVRDPSVWAGESLKTDPAKVRRMLDRAICLAFDKKNPIEAWRSVVKPTDVVGLKVNCLAGRTLATDRGLIDATAQSLIDAGVKPGNIIVWDRSDRELSNSGHKIQKAESAVRCFGTPAMTEKEYALGNGMTTALSTLLTDTCDVTINMPIFKAHKLSGCSGALKNHMGDMPKAHRLHPDDCLAVADLNTIAPIRERTRLVIMDALRPLWDGGPGDKPACRWKYNALLVSTDHVAIDRVCWAILEKKRKEVKGEPWPMRDAHIRRAGELGLGQADLGKIRVARA